MRSRNATRFRSCFGAGGARVATADGRLPGSGMRTPFTRPPRNRSWRPSSQSVGLAQKAARAHEPGGGDRGVRGERYPSRGTEENAVARRRSGRRSGKRAVKRGSPQSHLASGGPEPPGAWLRASSDGRSSTPEKTLEWMGTEPQGSGTRAVLGRAPKGLAREMVAALGNDGSTSARVGTVSECRSRSDASWSRRPGVLPSTPRTRAT